jgi:hypothetical protein
MRHIRHQLQTPSTVHRIPATPLTAGMRRIPAHGRYEREGGCVCVCVWGGAGGGRESERERERERERVTCAWQVSLTLSLFLSLSLSLSFSLATSLSESERASERTSVRQRGTLCELIVGGANCVD